MRGRCLKMRLCAAFVAVFWEKEDRNCDVQNDQDRDSLIVLEQFRGE
jgi:hypothetical protein